MKKFFKWTVWAATVITAVFFLAALALYIPPIQQFVKNRVTHALSESSGMDIHIERVRLAFPLDLAVVNLCATEGRDTLLAAGNLRLDVRLLPLLHRKIDIGGIELYRAKVDTKSYVSDTHIMGRIGTLEIDEPTAVDLRRQQIDVGTVRLKQADIRVLLSDTAREDTTQKEPTKWKIRLGKALISRCTFYVQMPGDSMRLAGNLPYLKAEAGSFDLGREQYLLRRLTLKDGQLNYDIPQERYAKGFDYNHITASSLHLRADSFSYDDGRLRVAVPLLSFKEKSGLSIDRMDGRVDLDSTGVNVPRLHLKTPGSELSAQVSLPWDALSKEGKGKMDFTLEGRFGKKDIGLLLGEAAKNVYPYLPAEPVSLSAQGSGNMAHLNLQCLTLGLPSKATLTLDGNLNRILSGNRLCRLNYRFGAPDTRFLQKMLPQSLRSTIGLPSKLTLSGTIGQEGRWLTTRSTLHAGKGSLLVDGRFNPNTESYSAHIDAKQFPLHSFLKTMPLSPLTAAIDAHGSGLDFLSGRTRLAAKGDIRYFSYDNYPLHHTSIKAQLNGAHGTADIVAANPMLKGRLGVTADVGRRQILASVTGRIDDFAMSYVNGTTDSTHFMADVDLKGYYRNGGKEYGAGGEMKNINLTGPSIGYPADDVLFNFATAPDTTYATIESGDISARLNSDRSVDQIAGRATAFAQKLTEQIKRAKIDEQELSLLLPDMTLYVEAGKNNPVSHLLRLQGYALDSVLIDLNTEHGTQLNGNFKVLAFNTGNLLLERTTARLYQDSTGLRLDGKIENTSRKNPNRFTATLNGAVLPDGLSVETKFVDEKGVEGLNLGLRAQMAENGDLTFHLFPEQTTIAYRRFTVNKDNFLTLGKDKHISADVDLLADDRTGLKITTPKGDSTRDVTISLSRCNLSELTAVMPYVPHLGGLLSGDVHATWKNENLSAVAELEMNDFSYEGTALGDVGLELAYLPQKENVDEHVFSGTVSSSGQEVMNLLGTYINNDVDSLNAEVNLTQFPAALLNGFLSNDGTAALAGKLNGTLNITGPTSAFVINGQVTPDSLHVLSPLYGVNLRVGNEPVNIEGSKILLDSISLYSTADNPLLMSGNVDFSHLDVINLNLRFKAKDFLVVNSPKTKESLLYGKVYSDIDATLKGTTDFMRLNGKLNVLDGTNMTYIMKDSPLTVEDQLSGLVEFVDFSDTTKIEKTDAPPPGGLFMSLAVKVSNTARLHCELSADGSSYFDCKGGGDLSMKYFPSGEISLMGRYTMSEGEMKYELPFIPLKTFKLKEDSYITFTGEPSNPTLHITAMEKTRASVNDEGSSTRMVTFNVGVAISQTLNNMGLQFLIEAPEDLNVQNELASMSDEERGKLAVSMLATGMYLTSTNKSSFKANNALNAFLQNEIQNIAGDALKTIDITVGVEGSTSASGNAQTDYSFQFAKHLWNDRVTFKIGGKVTAGSENANENQSFIDNISLEYRLDKSSSKNLRLFYDHDNVDPLEGNYSSAGAGLVLRKKTDTFGELFLFHPRRNKAAIKPDDASSKTSR